MIRRLMIVALALLFVSACNALDHDNTPFEGFSERDVPFNPFITVAPYEGIYSGTIVLESLDEGCIGVEDVVGEEKSITLDIIQANEYINVKFADETEAEGKLFGSKVTVVKKNMNDTRMFHLEFLEGGLIEGACDVLAGSGENASVEPCAIYSLSLSKGN